MWNIICFIRSNFFVMEKNKDEQIKEFKIFINNLPKKKNFLTHQIYFKPFYKKSIDFKTKKTDNETEIIFKNNQINYFLVVFLLASAIFSILNFDKSDDKFYIGIGIIIFVFSIVLYTKFKKHKIIKINENGFFINNEIFYWKDIYDYGIYTQYKPRNSSYSIYLFSFEKEIKSYDVSEFHFKKIIEKMNFFRNKYNSNRNHS